MAAIRVLACHALRSPCVALGVALLAGAPLPAQAQRAPTPTATGPAPASRPAAGLPALLDAADAARLRRIFQLQARGAWAAAQAEAERVGDQRLIGHVRADAWTRPGAPPADAAALRAWLADHADHPDAPAIARKLAALPGEAPPDLPAPPDGPAATAPGPAQRVTALHRALRERGRQGEVAAALAQIAALRGLNAEAAARLRAEVAYGLFQAGLDETAFRLAAEAAAAAPGEARAAFVAGLAAWSLGRWDAALAQFERAAQARGAGPATRAAAAFWTARAAIRARRPALHGPWMMQAAQEPRTFYGMVARRALGLSPGFAWTQERLGSAEAALLAETAAGWRALALLQIGRADRAEAELVLLWRRARGNPALARAVLALASHAELGALLAEAAAATLTEDGQPRDFLRYPLPALRPAGGFSVDPALLYAVALQESRFETGAISSAGARGLMQIMPATASYLAENDSLRDAEAWRLHDPALSMELGQRYLLVLARSETIGSNLIRILAAYNAGPGNVARWLPANSHRDDPFLFIEAIPYDETRHYVRAVLANSWAYASRLGLPAPSLDALAEGRFPTFLGVAQLTAMLAPPPAVPPRRGPTRRAAPPQRLAAR